MGMLPSGFLTHTGFGGTNENVLLSLNVFSEVERKPSLGGSKLRTSVTGETSGHLRDRASRLATLAGVQGCHSRGPTFARAPLPVGWLASELAKQ